MEHTDNSPSQTEADIPPGDPAPDWQRQKEEIHCPMCEYNLRGLTEPRCPECGYRFAWKDLLDARMRPHPYLFEHHPEANLWSFWKTAKGGLRPAKFWTTLHPAMPSRPRRLILYWVLTVLLSSLLLVGFFLFTWAETNAEFQWERTRLLRQWPGSQTTNPSYQQWLAQRAPAPPSAPEVLEKAAANDLFLYVAALTAVVVLWPWFTFFVLMIFRISMRRARVRSIHVLRCVLYCFDVTLWVGPIELVVLGAQALFLKVPQWIWWKDVWVLLYQAHALAALVLAIGAWRLAVAYRRYLKFDFSTATVAASQAILVLAFFAIAINTHTEFGAYWQDSLIELMRFFVNYFRPSGALR
jgi:hypothetical protein